jgi:hypothetical protein
MTYSCLVELNQKNCRRKNCRASHLLRFREGSGFWQILLKRVSVQKWRGSTIFVVYCIFINKASKFPPKEYKENDKDSNNTKELAPFEPVCFPSQTAINLAKRNHKMKSNLLNARGFIRSLSAFVTNSRTIPLTLRRWNPKEEEEVRHFRASNISRKIHSCTRQVQDTCRSTFVSNKLVMKFEILFIIQLLKYKLKNYY